jgi:hypothetical protein
VIETKDLQLVVERQVEGELLTNAVKIREFVLDRVKDYSPENYIGKVKEAKDDRAVLNKAAKELNDKRLELERQFMAPFQEFKRVIGETVDAIKDASSKVGTVISEVEEREREERREEIRAFYTGTGFYLVPLGKLLDPKWLNKSTSKKAWTEEFAAKIDKIKSDLSSLDSVEFAADAKAFYLDTLDIGQALQHARSLKERRDALEAQEKARQEEQAKPEEPQPTEASEPQEAPPAEMQPEDPAEQAEEVFKFVIEVSGTRSQMAALRKFIDANGITYRKLDTMN